MKQADKDKFLKMIEDKSQAITKAVDEKYSNIYIDKSDHFVWLDVTEQVKDAKRRSVLWLAHELFIVHDDDTESLITTDNEIEKAIKDHEKICIEIGFIPKDFIKDLLKNYFNSTIY